MSYIEKVLELQTMPKPPGVYHVYVRHDDGCPVLSGIPDCTCPDPVVEYGPSPTEGDQGREI